MRGRGDKMGEPSSSVKLVKWTFRKRWRLSRHFWALLCLILASSSTAKGQTTEPAHLDKEEGSLEALPPDPGGGEDRGPKSLWPRHQKYASQEEDESDDDYGDNDYGWTNSDDFYDGSDEDGRKDGNFLLDFVRDWTPVTRESTTPATTTPARTTTTTTTRRTTAATFRPSHNRVPFQDVEKKRRRKFPKQQQQQQQRRRNDAGRHRPLRRRKNGNNANKSDENGVFSLSWGDVTGPLRRWWRTRKLSRAVDRVRKHGLIDRQQQGALGGGGNRNPNLPLAVSLMFAAASLLALVFLNNRSSAADTSLQDQINSLQATVNSLNSRVTSLNSQLGSVSGSVGSLQSQVVSAPAVAAVGQAGGDGQELLEVADGSPSLSRLVMLVREALEGAFATAKDVGVVGERAEDNKLAIIDLKNMMDALKAESSQATESIKLQLQSLQSSLPDLTEAGDHDPGAAPDLASSIKSLEDEVEMLRRDSQTVQEAMSELQSREEERSSNIRANSEKITDVEDLVDALRDSCEASETQSESELVGRVERLDEQLGTLVSDVDGLARETDKEIQALMKYMASLNESDQGQDEMLAMLKERVKEIEGTDVSLAEILKKVKDEVDGNTNKISAVQDQQGEIKASVKESYERLDTKATEHEEKLSQNMAGWQGANEMANLNKEAIERLQSMIENLDQSDENMSTMPSHLNEDELRNEIEKLESMLSMIKDECVNDTFVKSLVGGLDFDLKEIRKDLTDQKEAQEKGDDDIRKTVQKLINNEETVAEILSEHSQNLSEVKDQLEKVEEKECCSGLNKLFDELQQDHNDMSDRLEMQMSTLVNHNMTLSLLEDKLMGDVENSLSKEDFIKEMDRMRGVLDEHNARIGSTLDVLNMLKQSAVNKNTYEQREKEVSAILDDLMNFKEESVTSLHNVVAQVVEQVSGAEGIAGMVVEIKEALPDINASVKRLMEFKTNTLVKLTDLGSRIAENKGSMEDLLNNVHALMQITSKVTMLDEFKKNAQVSIDSLTSKVEQVREDLVNGMGKFDQYRKEFDMRINMVKGDLSDSTEEFRSDITDINKMLDSIKEKYLNDQKLLTMLAPLEEQLQELSVFKEVTSQSVIELVKKVAEVRDMTKMVKDDYVTRAEKDALQASIEDIQENEDTLNEFKSTATDIFAELVPDVESIQSMVDMIKSKYVTVDDKDNINAMIQELIANQASLQNKFDESRVHSSSATSDVKKDMDSLRSMLNMVKSNQATTENALETLQSKTVASQLELETLQNDVLKEFNNFQTDSADKWSKLEEMMNMVKNNQAVTATSIDNLKEQTSESQQELREEMDNYTESLSSNLASINSNISTLEEMMAKVKKAMEMVKSDASMAATTLNKTQQDLKDELNAHKDKWSAKESDWNVDISTLRTMLDMVKDGQAKAAAAFEMHKSDTATSVMALQSADQSLQASLSMAKSGLGALCSKVSEITDIKSPVYSSTARRWFLEELKEIESPECSGLSGAAA